MAVRGGRCGVCGGLREAAGKAPLPAFNLQRVRPVPSPAGAGDDAAAAHSPALGSWHGRGGGSGGAGGHSGPPPLGLAGAEERGQQQSLCGVKGGGGGHPGQE